MGTEDQNEIKGKVVGDMAHDSHECVMKPTSKANAGITIKEFNGGSQSGPHIPVTWTDFIFVICSLRQAVHAKALDVKYVCYSAW